MLSVSAAENLHILETVLSVVTFARRIAQILRPDKSCIPCRAWLDLDLLALMALDHELRSFEVVAFDVVDVDRAIRVNLRHGGGVLPGEQVVRAFTCAHSRVEWAKLEAVKFAIDEGWCFLFVLALFREASLDTTGWLRKVTVAVDLDLTGLAWRLGGSHP